MMFISPVSTPVYAKNLEIKKILVQEFLLSPVHVRRSTEPVGQGVDWVCREGVRVGGNPYTLTLPHTLGRSCITCHAPAPITCSQSPSENDDSVLLLITERICNCLLRQGKNF